MFIPIPGDAMRILETTTWEIACCAAFVDSPNLLSFSSVIGMPCWSSLKTKSRWAIRISFYNVLSTTTTGFRWALRPFRFGRCSLPLSHQWDVDAVSSSYSSKWDKSSNQRWNMLQQKRTGIKTGGKSWNTWLRCVLTAKPISPLGPEDS